ncbi:hypothetical protein A3A63_02920 [Candidatus Gottesmanbacteria bacterium RIFCSPLOWO2_01_FULL_46_9]|uniref:Uncharacterized protein n=1 Tax=Candidatus Gottesmanbacteria bacterium RIFCSPLOWO2_01_FULL_46_9 TaxID=1798394 RepID=A0A1F6B0A6_9BACT|nr:MAG: hypothetical protein A3A63_02920 [Candidatus Gottesmanbacteria bacterium RIFCSPLOWO2_01_FULL_46_9]
MAKEYRKVSELNKEELEEYSSVSWQVIIYVVIGTLVGLLFDRFHIFSFLSEGLVRAIAGTADTLGLTVAALVALGVRLARDNSKLVRKNVPDLGKPKAITWILGGLFGLAVAFLIQALVFTFSSDPHGPIGVAYAFGFSNLDNTFAGLSVLVAALFNHGKRGWFLYWKHPFFFGNAVMLFLIPCVALLYRLTTGFRPDLNFSAGVESGLMDVDSVGAAIIFLVATKHFGVKVPYVNDDLSDINKKTVKLLKTGP